MLQWVEFAINSSPYSVNGNDTILSQDGIRPDLADECVAGNW
jgi:hypothetical protein